MVVDAVVMEAMEAIGVSGVRLKLPRVYVIRSLPGAGLPYVKNLSRTRGGCAGECRFFSPAAARTFPL